MATSTGSAFACVKCGSDRIKSLKLVHEDGFMRNLSGTTGVAVSRGGVAVGAATTKGVSQSETSRRYAPPATPQTTSLFAQALFFALILALIIAYVASNSPWMLLVAVPVAVWVYVKVRRSTVVSNAREQSRYSEAMGAWERSYLCERCGQVFAL